MTSEAEFREKAGLVLSTMSEGVCDRTEIATRRPAANPRDRQRYPTGIIDALCIE
jgi:hypothetical protein